MRGSAQLAIRSAKITVYQPSSWSAGESPNAP